MDALYANAGPLLRYSLALFWSGSAITGMLDLRGWSVLLVNQLAIGMGVALSVVGAACIINAVLALFVVRGWKPRQLAPMQFLLVLAYTAIATLLFPSLWLEPLGPLLKNVPILAAIVAWGALEGRHR